VSLDRLAGIAMNQEDYEVAERLFRDGVRLGNRIGVPLGRWHIENGYTDPDAEWDFPQAALQWYAEQNKPSEEKEE